MLGRGPGRRPCRFSPVLACLALRHRRTQSLATYHEVLDVSSNRRVAAEPTAHGCTTRFEASALRRPRGPVTSYADLGGGDSSRDVV
ncbi:hypothetical protein VFPPC_17646 [Pochonia chlamydosporia 170]|uniref:Uncharacterized protein n=1 Tax=Pochonia chlamydosporia 170 TaxID=1380566 RepID=A0A219AQW9_METCM|nr:hypothetical protein VFPPC_17646 [Pochonia chlamydosporia 170]OWT43178.1 hypothetical protein VFPPC_17646 [Pochonia chlamydosporia 170]